MCGVCVVSVWCMCGVRVVYVLRVCSVCVVYVWCMCGVCVVYVWYMGSRSSAFFSERWVSRQHAEPGPPQSPARAGAGPGAAERPRVAGLGRASPRPRLRAERGLVLCTSRKGRSRTR